MSTDTITSNVTTGVTLASGGTYSSPVTVASGVEVSGNPAISISAPWTVVNDGTVSGSTLGILVSAAGAGYTQAWITNTAGGTIVAAGHGIGIGDGSGPITIDNAGYIGSYRGVVLTGGSVTNEATGTIAGAGIGIAGYRAAATITNAGTIAGNLNDGIRLANYTGSGSSVIDNTGTIGSRYNNGVYITQSYATVENAGTIGAHYTDGVKIRATSASVENSGSIYGGTNGVYLSGTDVTLENSGTISGGHGAVYLEASGTNRLIVEAGAAFDGIVVAQATAANTLELSAAGGAGTIQGFGSQYQGFQSVTIDSGATWDIAGTVAGFNGTTIAGFGSHDRLDLTDLAFDAGDTVTLDNGSDLLTIKDSGGTVLATIQMDAGVTGDLFKLVSDGNGGTFAEESDYAACYCQGTLIRTPSGEVAVEDLRIGDLVVTAGGEALPLKWIGRRSYRDWPAVGNADVQPILFKAGSLADRVPARDLYVSPEHAMFIDAMLIPARHLVNGLSILKMTGLDSVDYFHLEFDRHVVIFAEGAMAESFVDDDSRILFHNAAEYRRLYPDDAPRQAAEFCAPRVKEGYVLEALRRALRARATRLQSSRTAARVVRHGYIDRATRTAVEGWALGDGVVSLAIVVNGAVVGRALADRHRADLSTSGLGDCSFRFALPRPLSPELSHRIEVRRESDWSLLHGGPTTLKAANCRS